MVINNKYKISMNLRSVYMAYNMLATFAVTRLIGLKDDKIVDSLNNYIMKNDRVQKFELEGKHAMLLTSKHENSISYNQSLLYVTREKEDCTVILIVDAVSRKYFTSETSWLWDIDFELLKSESVKKVILGGKYVNDLVTRMDYAEIDKEKIIAKSDLDELMKEAKENSIGKVYVITCFSDRMKFLNRR
jgi:UDP-N-acetylmuramyl tripeptide synthase